MKFRRSGAALGLVLSSALLLGACTSETPEEDPTTDPSATAETTEETTEDATTEPSEGESPDASEGAAGCLQDVGISDTAEGQVAVTVGPGSWSGYNSVTSKTYSTYNNAVSDQMFSGFVYFGTDGSICENTEFGTLEVVSEDPLQVKYTISDDAVWSDGTPVTINDYLMDYASQNPEWLVPGYASGEDLEAVAVFDHVSTSFAADAPDGPVGEVGAKEFTVTFEKKNPDYRIIITSALPSHVVAEQAGLEPEAFAQAILDKDAETVKQAADFWNTGWAFNPGELPDEALIPSSGPYKIKAGGWEETALTLTANESYWGTPAGTQDLIFRFIEDAAMSQALQNGDVQAIEPQPTVDTLAQLQAIGSSVTVESFSQLTWEHLDFNFRDASAFSESQGGLALREAFALCVPRQGIVDSLVKPVDPAAEVMNAREVFPFQDNYDEVVSTAYDGRYDAVDIEASKAKVAESGVTTPVTVRLGYRAGNQRRTETVAAIAASCKEAGFDVQDASAEDFFEVALPNGDYEVALFAWAGSGQIASGENIYATNLPQNYGEYSNPEVDEAWTTLATSLDPEVHAEQVKVIEKLLWDDLFGIPLYAHPGVAAWDARLQNVRPTAAQNGISWNASQWVLN